MFKVGDIIRHYQSGSEYEVVKAESYGTRLKFKGYENLGYFDSRLFSLVQSSSPTAANWRIESDGSAAGTKVYLNNVQVNNVASVSFYAQANQIPVLTLELNGSRVA